MAYARLVGRGVVSVALTGADVFIDVQRADWPLTISLDPTSGAMDCYLSTDPTADGDSAHRSWEEWAKGAVSSISTDIWPGHTVLVRLTGAGSARVMS